MSKNGLISASARVEEGELSPPPSIAGFLPGLTSSYADPTPPAWRPSDGMDYSRRTSAASVIRLGVSDNDLYDELPPPVTLAADKHARGPRQRMPATEQDSRNGIDSIHTPALEKAHRSTGAGSLNGGTHGAARRPSSESVDVSTPRILPGTHTCLVNCGNVLKTVCLHLAADELSIPLPEPEEDVRPTFSQLQLHNYEAPGLSGIAPQVWSWTGALVRPPPPQMRLSACRAMLLGGCEARGDAIWMMSQERAAEAARRDADLLRLEKELTCPVTHAVYGAPHTA